MNSPGFFRLLSSLFYDALLVLALLFVATFIFLTIFGSATEPPYRYYLQVYLWGVAGLYFVWCWSHGQTLAMQAWRIRLVDRAGRPVSAALAIQRYLLASLGLLAAGVGFFWALADRDHRFLHDRLLGLRLVVDKPLSR